MMNRHSDAHDVKSDVTRRDFLHASLAGVAGLAVGGDGLVAATDQEAVIAEIARQHDATV
jgi:hypothetical protein